MCLQAITNVQVYTRIIYQNIHGILEDSKRGARPCIFRSKTIEVSQCDCHFRMPRRSGKHGGLCWGRTNCAATTSTTSPSWSTPFLWLGVLLPPPAVTWRTRIHRSVYVVHHHWSLPSGQVCDLLHCGMSGLGVLLPPPAMTGQTKIHRSVYVVHHHWFPPSD